MSNRKLDQQEREDVLSNYMDAINEEKKPDYEEIFEVEEDDELLEMLQTVCAVKRLREDIEENKFDNVEVIANTKTPAKEEISKSSKKRGILLKRIMATAAMVAILVSGGLTYESIKDTKEAKNVAYAVIKQYDLIHNFKGVLQETIVNKDSATSQKIEIQYVEPNKFYAVHHLEGGTTKKLYNGGDTIYEYDRIGNLNMRTIDDDSLKFELLTYRADRKIVENSEGLKNAKAIGEEKIAGRSTDIYEFSYTDKGIKHKIWIDKELGISLKESFEDANGMKLISEFIEFENDIKIVLPTITKEEEIGANDERLTEEQKEKEKELKDIKAGFMEGEKLRVEFIGLADANSAEFKVGENYFVFGINEGVKDKFSNLKTGTKLNITIGFEQWTTNPVVREVN